MKTERPTARRILGMVIGIVIISLGIAIFKQSHLGNDSITAMNIRLSELLGISLGVQNICTNLVFLVVEFIWGRKYIGLGTLARASTPCVLPIKPPIDLWPVPCYTVHDLYIFNKESWRNHENGTSHCAPHLGYGDRHRHHLTGHCNF